MRQSSGHSKFIRNQNAQYFKKDYLYSNQKQYKNTHINGIINKQSKNYVLRNLSLNSVHGFKQKQTKTLSELMALKSQLQTLPNSQNYPKTRILNEHYIDKPTFPQKSTKTSNKNDFKRQYPQLLKFENLQCQIKNTFSINQSSQKKNKHFFKDQRKINQFTLKDPIQESIVRERQNFCYNEDTSGKFNKKKGQKLWNSTKVDERINDLQNRIKQFDRKKKSLDIQNCTQAKKNYFVEHKKSSHKQFTNNDNILTKTISFNNFRSNFNRTQKYSKLQSTNYYNQDNSDDVVSPTFAGLKQNNNNLFKSLKNAHTNEENIQQQRIFTEDSFRGESASVKKQIYKQIQQQYKQKTYHLKTMNQISTILKKNCSIQKLANALCTQVQLDDDFRISKIWLKLNKNPVQWDTIKSKLQQKQIRMSVNEIEQQFKVFEIQENPFYSVNEQSSTLQKLINNFIKSKKHWQEHIQKQHKMQSLLNEGFTQQSIDLNNKGYLVIEDFVRFVNIQTGSFFRNRDLYAVFMRLAKNKDRMLFQDFISVIAQ